MIQPEPPPQDVKGPSIWDLVIADAQERQAFGIAKYGVPVRAFNGRRALVDAYQEQLDLLCYLRQEIAERDKLEQENVALRARIAELECRPGRGHDGLM